MKVVFFGTPPFAAEVLRYLFQEGIDIRAVVTKPDRPQGRSGIPLPTAVKCAAQELNSSLPVFQPEIVSTLEFAPILKSFDADLFVVVAYGEIIKQHLLDMPKIACINLHASLLPKYRGAAPIQRSIINSEKETGITIMHMVKKMDAGDIIESQKVPIDPNMTYGELEKVLCDVGSRLLCQIIRNFEKGINKRIPQDSTEITYAPKLELEDCQIDWQQPAEAIHNLIRGVNPHPGAWCLVEVKGQKKRLKIFKTQIVNDALKLDPGKIKETTEDFIIGCGKGAIKLIQLQIEGKKVMNAEELMRGFQISTLKFL